MFSSQRCRRVAVKKYGRMVMRRRRAQKYEINAKPKKSRKVLKALVIFSVIFAGAGIDALTVASNHQTAKNNSAPAASNSIGLNNDSSESISPGPPPPVPQYQSQLNNLLSGINASGFNPSTVSLNNPLNSSFYSQLSKPSSGSSFCMVGCHVYDSSGHYITLNCYSTINSCSAYDSSGGYLHINCYSYINSCSTSDSDGNYYSTHCYSYINSCSTTGSNGYSSNTNCYSYINSCSTTDSSGSLYNTHCYSYINSCTTTGSNGYYGTTNCSNYISSCTTNSYSGL
jgi:hypothetical protein